MFLRFMSRRFVYSLSLSTILAISSGCASTDGDGFGFTGTTTSDVDPIFAAAKKTLDQPERAFLSYANWKADIGQLAEARGAYENILSSDGSNVDALVGLAGVELKAGRIAQAEKNFQQAVGINPSNAKAVYALGKFYAGQDKTDDAVAMLSKAVTEEPTNPSYRFDLGVALAKSGQINEGLSHLALTVGEAEANYNLGYLLNEQGKSREAIPYLRQAVALKPSLQQAHDLIAGITSGGRPQNVADTSTFSGQVPATTVSIPNYSAPTNIQHAPVASTGQTQQRYVPPQQPVQRHYVQPQSQVAVQQIPGQQRPVAVNPANNGYRAPQPATVMPVQQIQPQQRQRWQQSPAMPMPQAQSAPQGRLPQLEIPTRRQVYQTIQQASATQAAPASTGLTPAQLQQLLQATKTR